MDNMIICPECTHRFKLQPKILYVGDEVHVKRSGITFTGFISHINTIDEIYYVLFPVREKAIIETYKRHEILE